MPWSTGGGCLQPLVLLNHDVVVSFLCWAGGGWGKESILEDPMLESLCIEIHAAAATLVFWYGLQIMVVFKALRVAWQTFKPDPRKCSDALPLWWGFHYGANDAAASCCAAVLVFV